MAALKHAFVMDCSVTISLLLSGENQGEIKHIESLLLKNSAIVPTIWKYEVSNVLCMSERSKRISEAELAEIKNILDALPISIDDLSTTKTLGNTLHIAREQKLTIYDAAYLELAMREGVALATFDKELIKAAKQVGVELVGEKALANL